MKKATSAISLFLAFLLLFSSMACAGDALNITGATCGEANLLDYSAVAQVPADGTITVVFDGNVTDETVWDFNLSKISVNSTETTPNYDVDPDATNPNAVIITLKGLEKGSYTLKFGGKVKDTNGKTLGTGVELPFNVKGSGTGTGGGNNPLTIVYTKVGENDLKDSELNGNETITVKFERGMDTNWETSKTLIGVYKKNGTKADITIGDPYKDEADTKGAFVKITLNNLEAGNYKLTFGAGIKANNGNTLGEDVVIPFSVKAEEIEPLTVASVKVGENDLKDKDIQGTETITITFSNGINKNADNVNYVAVYDADNNVVSCTKTVTDNKVITLSVETLEPGSYTVKIAKNIKANNGAQLAEDVSCAFTIRIAETTCTCFCHAKDGIKAFLWSIAVFFCKIFKLVPVCACGKAHY